jgi:diadenosine tetraphosphate (Ap4A) HIT family hydrolase
MRNTLNKFGYPKTLVKEYQYWNLLLRPTQATLGSLILITKGNESNFADLPIESFQEQKLIIKEIEKALIDLVNYEKINYLMLMMVDPEVHFHIIPRYSKPRVFKQISFPDYGWPGIPDLSKSTKISDTILSELVNDMKLRIK